MTLNVCGTDGKSIVRTISSAWKLWHHQSTENDGIKEFPISDNNDDIIQFLNEPLIRTVKNRNNKRNNDENDFNLNSNGNSFPSENNSNLLKNERIGKTNSYDSNYDFSDFIVGAKCTIELETRKYMNSRRSDLNLKNNHNNNNDDNNDDYNNYRNKDEKSNIKRNDRKILTDTNSRNTIIGWSILNLTSYVPSSSTSSLISFSATTASSSSSSPSLSLSPSPILSSYLSSPSPLSTTSNSLLFSNPQVEEPVINIVNNGLWRINIRKRPVNGVSDPSEKSFSADTCVGSFLLRVIDIERQTIANKWVLKDGKRKNMCS